MAVSLEASAPRLSVYELSRHVARNDTDCESLGEILRFTTAKDCWSYSVEFPRSGNLPKAPYLLVPVQIKIHRGSVGIGVLRDNGNDFVEEVQVPPDDTWHDVTLTVSHDLAIGSLMVRNTSYSGSSEGVIKLLPTQAADSPPAKRVPILELNGSSLLQFKPWSGRVPAGYLSDWTGIKTRATVEHRFARQPTYWTARQETPTIQPKTEQIIDWLTVSDAVVSSGETFRMTALGAGWGRWIAAGGALARQLGKKYFLIGVEADPDHFRWMKRHLVENDFDLNFYRLIEAAISDTAGTCHFEVGDPQAWYGQSILKRDDPSRKTITVRTVTIKDVLGDSPPIDYLHMDVQGVELDVLSSYPEIVDERVRLINVGTHSAEIDVGLRKFFGGLGWQSLYEVPLGASFRVRIDREENVINFQDGVQVWRNVRLNSL